MLKRRIEVDEIGDVERQVHHNIGLSEQTRPQSSRHLNRINGVAQPATDRRPARSTFGHEGIERRRREDRIVEKSCQVKNFAAHGDANSSVILALGRKDAVGKFVETEGSGTGQRGDAHDFGGFDFVARQRL
jgi:hypothetical protein